MINKSYLMIWSGLLFIIVLSAMLYSGIDSPVLHILLAIGFIIVGLGILLGFIKMVSDGEK
ncbi:MAG: hypothetical protein GQ572_11395 [Gammaproteobacteria bacterium]|jgi:hypothetical protein|nr:hypothetical protein [Gammaproteobacteria bacterium]